MSSSRLVEKIEKGEPSDLIWQEAISLSESIRTEYNDVLVGTVEALRHARHPDTIAVLSTCLIEHLLDYDFAGFDTIEDEIRNGNDRLLFALSLSTKFGSSTSAKNSARWDSLLAEYKDRLKSFRANIADQK
jgi:hypothetical protein